MEFALDNVTAPAARRPRRARLALLVAALAAALLAPSGVATATAASESPVVHPDRTVTFTLTAPTASEVTLSYQGAVRAVVPMVRDEDGVFSITVGPLDPNYYDYQFTVDGVPTRDPANDNLLAPGSTTHLFLVPGPAADFLTEQDVAHGQVTHLDYHSDVTGTVRQATVWTPPDYKPRGPRYPTFYLVHGGGGDHHQWNTVGRASVILDNLYAAGQLEPMVVVMPDADVPGAGGHPSDDQFPTELLDNLVPAVEKAYNVSRARHQRALAGQSLGGLQTWNTLLTRPGQFDYIGDMISGYFGPTIEQLEAEGDLFEKRNLRKINQTELHVIYIGNSTDIAYGNNVATRALFDRVGVEYVFGGVYEQSGHTFDTTRHNLLDFAPRLFK